MFALMPGKIAWDASCKVLSRSKSQTGVDAVIFDTGDFKKILQGNCMRRQIIVVFVSLFWLALSPAWGADRGALFKVEGSGHTMYLFGTIHVGQPGFYPLEPRIVAAVSGASKL